MDTNKGPACNAPSASENSLNLHLSISLIDSELSIENSVKLAQLGAMLEVRGRAHFVFFLSPEIPR